MSVANWMMSSNYVCAKVNINVYECNGQIHIESASLSRFQKESSHEGAAVVYFRRETPPHHKHREPYIINPSNSIYRQRATNAPHKFNSAVPWRRNSKASEYHYCYVLRSQRFAVALAENYDVAVTWCGD